MTMNLQELIEQLEEIAEEFDARGVDPSDVEVRIAHQRNYPLQSSVYTLTSHEDESKDENIVYVAEGSQIYDNPYGSDWMWDGEHHDASLDEEEY